MEILDCEALQCFQWGSVYSVIQISWRPDPGVGGWQQHVPVWLGRCAQQNTMGTDYFLADATSTSLSAGLGSVRQLTDESGAVTLAQSYTPYGEAYSSEGSGASSYGFTGEWRDRTGMIYLRARYYAPWDGRFTTRDTWVGDYDRPLSLNRWNYVEGNPINRTDPTGKWVCTVDSLLFNPNCTEWVEDALDQLENGGAIGQRVATTFHELDRKYKLISLGSCVHPPLATHILGIKIAFVPNPGIGMVLPGTILLNPDHINGPKATGRGLVTFAHEISHLEQGVMNAFSVQAEMLTAILSYQLEAEIGEQHHQEGVDIVNNQWNPWDDNDLHAFKTHQHWKNHFRPFPLRPIWGDLPKDWLKQWGTTFPYTISP